MSPDGATLLIRNHGELTFAPIAGGMAHTYAAGGPRFGVTDAELSLAWSSDSKSIWFLAGETTSAGFVAGPLHCARRLLDGRVVAAPALNGLPGRLDQVTWVDGEGLGIAHLDTRGGYNRPELPDNNPAVAVIEAQAGVVRSVLPLRDAIASAWGAGRGSVFLEVLAASRLADGRIRAVLRCGLTGQNGGRRVGGVAVWTEGKSLEPLPSLSPQHLWRMAFTKDGEALLVGRPLSASGLTIEGGESPPPIPVSGRFAGLYDLTGRLVWSLSGTADEIRGPTPLVVSRSGRTALLALSETCGGKQVWAVVGMASGKILRRLDHGVPYNRADVAGFHGEQPWLASYVTLQFF